jgi:hypothetical protein
MMNFNFLIEFGLGVGLIVGFLLGQAYRGLVDKWKFRNKK